MKFFLETYGCQMNKSDSAGLIQQLINNGFELVNTHFDADAVILNTCSVRKTAENRIWGRIGFYKNFKQSKNIILVIMGCMAQRVGEHFFLENKCVDIVV
jgi:tRNA-2-methylthio-N6-dimethylallyladenosine synthase